MLKDTAQDAEQGTAAAGPSAALAALREALKGCARPPGCELLAELPGGRTQPLVMVAAAVPVLAHYAERLQRDVWHLLASRVEAGELPLYLVRGDRAAADTLGVSTVLRAAVAERAKDVQMVRRRGFVGAWQDQQPHRAKHVSHRAAVDALTGPGGAAVLLRMAASGTAAAANREAPVYWPRLALSIQDAVALARVLAPAVFAPVAAAVLPLAFPSSDAPAVTSARTDSAETPCTPPERLKNPGDEWTRELEDSLLQQHQGLMAQPGAKKEQADIELGEVWGISASAVKQARLRAQRREDSTQGQTAGPSATGNRTVR
jgi:hypothetical protein